MGVRRAKAPGWHTYIRGDLRRELLRFECEELENLLSDYRPRKAPDEWDVTKTKQDGFAAKTLKKNGECHVFLAGRNFFVDPSIATIENEQEYHRYLIFLSFAQVEKSLKRIAKALGSIHNATLFVPWILWEEIYAVDPDALQKWTVCPSDGYRWPRSGDEDDSRCVLVGFDRWLDLAVENELPDRVPGFFEDVRLHVSFAFSATPSLQAAFRCNGRTLFISRSEGIDAAQVATGPNSYSVVMGKLIPLMRRLRRRLVLRHDLQQHLANRVIEIQIWRQGGLPCDESRTMPMHRLVRPRWGQLPRQWSVPRGPEYGPQIAIARPTGSLSVPEQTAPCEGTDLESMRIEVPPTAPFSNDFDRKTYFGNLADQLIVTIACGRPATLTNRRPELVGPMLRFPASGKDGDTTLIEWQLAGVAALAREMGAERIKVLLVTTPLVGEEIVHLLDQLENRNAISTRGYHSIVEQPDREWNIEIDGEEKGITLNIHLVRGQLLTHSETEEKPEWQLSYNSHFDVVRSLRRFNEVQSDSTTAAKYALVLSHNNLGVLWKNKRPSNRGRSSPVSNIEQTARYIKSFVDSEQALAVEVFELQPDIKPRWAELSYFARTRCGASLIKKCWGETTSWSDHNPYFSSNTWYLDLDKVGEFVERGEFRRLKVADRHHVAEPIDLLTWKDAWTGHPGFGVFPHERPSDDDSPASENEFHRNSRFAVVLEDEQFNDLPKGLVAAPKTASETADELLPMIPTIKRNIWGGRQIALRKHVEIDGDPKFGETWEISTHPAGPSRYRDESGNERPLQQAVGSLKIMGKYLDCEQPLSIQIHPTSRSIGGTRAGPDLAKEETFYVIAPARLYEGDKERQHLIYGFNREELDKYVGKFRPWLVHQDTSVSPDSVIEELGEIMGEFFGAVVRIDEYTKDGNGNITRTKAQLKSLKNDLIERFKRDEEREPLAKAICIYAGVKFGGKNTPIPTDRLDGKEYLVVGAALIRALEVLSLQQDSKDSPFRSALRKHYTNRDDATGFRDSPVFGIFNAMQFSAGQWVRVPAGTPHAVQGGGNLLVELSNRSDHTYRILDFGREFTSRPRDMHFADAMGALDDQAFHYRSSEQRFVVNTSTRDFKVCHKDLESRLHERGRDHSREFEETKERTYYFNLGGEIRADTKKQSLPIPPFSSMVATRGTNVRLQLTEAEDRVLEVRNRISDKRVLYGYRPRYRVGDQGNWPGSDYVMFYEGGSPSVWWHAAPELPSNWDEIRTNIRLCLGGSDALVESSEGQLTGISYPGHVRYKRSGKAKLHIGSNATEEFTRQINVLAKKADVVVGDAQASALGEGHHMLGRFVASARGIVLNLSAGVCAGFWDRRLRHPRFMKLNDLPPDKEAVYDDADRRRMNLYSAIGAIGRWLYVDPTIPQYYFANGEPADAMPKNLEQLLKVWSFSNQIQPTITTCDGQNALRLSTWLSADAIALRAEKGVSNLDSRTDYSFDSYLSLYKENVDRIDHKNRFRELVEESNDQLETAIRSVAQDIAEVVRIVRDVTFQCQLEDDFLKSIVLTGAVAEGFGWVARGSGSTEYHDLLLEHIKQYCRTPGVVVSRSQIGAPAAREGAGLAGFCWGSNAL